MVPETRLEALRRTMGERGVEGFLVTNLVNIRYLVGFTGTAGLLLVLPQEAVFFTDFRYDEQAHDEVVGCRIEIAKGTLFDAMAAEPAAGARKIGFEGADLKYASFEKLEELLKGKELTSMVGVVEGQRLRKDVHEIERIRAAVALGDRIFEEICTFVAPGMTETEVAAEIDCRMRRAGAENPAFDTIVASGPRSSLPHAKPTNRALTRGDFVVMDFGAFLDGYASDMTRTILVGEPTAQQREVYEMVQAAQKQALGAVRSGLSGVDADRSARSTIEKGGYGTRFGHGLGHGLGLEVHEDPKLSQESKDTLEAGMVVTIEPGIYVPGWGGVRIEDVVVIRDGGCEVLTTSPKELVTV